MRTLTLVLSLVSTVCLAAGHPVTQPTFGSSPFFPQAPSVAAAGVMSDVAKSSLLASIG